MEDSGSKNKKFCECGCGKLIPFWNKRLKQERRFKQGHQTAEQVIKYRFRNGPRLDKRGPNSQNWKSGKTVHEGYSFLYRPQHHFAVNGYVREHRLVWEQERDACLLSWGHVHHKDENPSNNIWYNLQAMMHRDHTILHCKIDMSDRKCLLCNTRESFNYKQKTAWYRHPITRQEWLCRKCYYKIYYIEFTKRY